MAKDMEVKKLPLLSKHNKKKDVKKCMKKRDVKYAGTKKESCKICRKKRETCKICIKRRNM